MEKVILLSTVITILFVVFKYAEAKYLENLTLSLKLTIRNMVMIFSSSFIVLFCYYTNERLFIDFLHALTGTSSSITTRPPVFTGDPDF